MAVDTARHVLVIGASAAGTAVVDRLRERSYEGAITLIGAEAHAPYDRPPLSKQFLAGTWQPEQLRLRPDAHFRDLDIATRFGTSAVGVEPASRTVTLSDGSIIDYDRLVLATGLTTRQLPGVEGIAGVHVLRTLDDAVPLQSEFRDAQRVVVVGGGFVGSEAASVLSAAGSQVSIVASRGVLMDRQLGDVIAGQLTRAHRDAGIEVCGGPGDEVVAIESREGRAAGVRLSSGRVLPADLVLVGIGADPTIGWLRSSGLALGDGVLCAPDCSAEPGIFAAGDLARWHNQRFSLSMRLEHRTNATDQGRHVADRIIDRDSTPYTPVPYFWSEQLGLTLHAHGVLDGHDEVRIVEGSIAERRLVALYRQGDRLTGVLGIGAVKAVRQWRAALADGAAWADAVSDHDRA